ncbi:N-lysine methyltransferase setd6 [Aplysia californica]|uniref:N-lysine methyltransferase n=1 Tax=Aplysia californica TaxID=6500 RepID=A0ABM1A7K3_APLCA|nr:N-lysine methyltransferase setd6 [Aplysia californica]
MAAPCKRRGDALEDEKISHKKRATDDASDRKLDKFLEWCNRNDFKLSHKVRVGPEGSCAQYGMVAVEDIAEGYCLFQVPRSCLLMPENSGIADTLLKESDQLSETNQWIPLLISLLHEQSNPSSAWRPYLDLVPDYDALDLPMFWESSDVDRYLGGTGVDLAVRRDLKMVRDDFDRLVEPFFKAHDTLRNDKVSFEFFKKMVAFVMAYSFTEPAHKDKDSVDNGGQSKDGEEDEEEEDSEEEEPRVMPPMMVPMADMLNHVTDNNAKLTFGKEALKMVTTRPVKQGEEIFNTYGQVSNLHLMHMYGFAESYPHNSNDVVEIPSTCMWEAVTQLGQGGEAEKFCQEKWKFLEEQEVVSDTEIFVLGQDGIITDDICVQALKVLCMSREEFAEHMEQEGWSEAESDSSLSGESRLSLEKVATLKDSWRELLKKTAQIHLAKYPTSLSEDTDKLTSELPPRQRYSLRTSHGQKQLLNKLIDVCEGKS